VDRVARQRAFLHRLRRVYVARSALADMSIYSSLVRGLAAPAPTFLLKLFY